LLKAGKAREAVAAYSAAVTAAPYIAVLYGNRAAALLQCGSVNLALRDGQKCVALDPAYVKGYSRIATAWQQKGRLCTALDVCATALAVIDDSDDAGKKKAAADKQYFVAERARILAAVEERLAAGLHATAATGHKESLSTTAASAAQVSSSGGDDSASDRDSDSNSSGDERGPDDAGAESAAAISVAGTSCDACLFESHSTHTQRAPCCL
jgi:tetratricopeptide (TPR) repeat protein